MANINWVSTKRQSNLEIRTHQRLLPKRVAQSTEQHKLLRQRGQLLFWFAQPENVQERSTILNMIQMNSKAYKIAIKFHTEDRRKRFDRLAASLHRKENEFIKIRNQRKSGMGIGEEMEMETMSREEQTEYSIIESIISGFKDLLCCGK